MTIPPRRTRLEVRATADSRGGAAASAAALTTRIASVANAASRSALSVMRAPSRSADDAPGAHDEHPMREAEHLLDLARDEQDPHALGREAREQLVERLARADVDAARRLVRDEQPGSHEQGAREQQLLLVAARQRAGRPLDRRVERRTLDRTGHRRPLRPVAARSPVGSSTTGWRRSRSRARADPA